MGAKGTLKLTSSGAAKSLKFAGKTTKAGSGLGLNLGGLPRTVRAKRTVILKVRVRDQFGAAISGARVTITVRSLTRAGLADAKGRVTLAFRAPSNGSMKVTATAPGYRKVSKTIRVKR